MSCSILQLWRTRCHYKVKSSVKFMLLICRLEVHYYTLLRLSTVLENFGGVSNSTNGHSQKKRSFWVSWKKPAHFFTPHMRSTFLPLLHHTHILKQTYFHPLPTLRKRCWCVVFRTKAITRGGLYLLCECKIREKVNYDWSISLFQANRRTDCLGDVASRHRPDWRCDGSS